MWALESSVLEADVKKRKVSSIAKPPDILAIISRQIYKMSNEIEQLKAMVEKLQLEVTRANGL
jgi:hypothetical protein